MKNVKRTLLLTANVRIVCLKLQMTACNDTQSMTDLYTLPSRRVAFYSNCTDVSMFYEFKQTFLFFPCRFSGFSFGKDSSNFPSDAVLARAVDRALDKWSLSGLSTGVKPTPGTATNYTTSYAVQGRPGV